MLKFDGYQIVFQEVPDEISLVFNVTNCPYKCVGCHSEYLWDDTGTPLKDAIMGIIAEHYDEISCVCFMGGDHELSELVSTILDIRFMWPDLKICLYTGNDNPNRILYRLVDYIKIGHFDKERGGLSSEGTNQRMIKIDLKESDITYKFRKDYK